MIRERRITGIIEGLILNRVVAAHYNMDKVSVTIKKVFLVHAPNTPFYEATLRTPHWSKRTHITRLSKKDAMLDGQNLLTSVLSLSDF